ncbi:3-phosphoserine/phosphohydroxythreonine transaminase [Coralloluteibacterium stylophorae]|uniref:Phosphoserine aminotransferase n=1 Tax=Coralloluteibacterium stylophorae TaxID=1776034 RepID=A0A8J8AXW0_9GAMM|nr:3-phosphoserine/phosphohydroxythreonine transaminase [Coralloluteibacterium stylophorae]MBS7457479.1 3-phosphoserine/phosphohydroxythreonine transaminase [Coralloluteibacterium stylophorae]
MTRAYNFSAGPAALPEAVLRQAQAELLEWNGVRASVMEVSHRGAAFEALAAEAERDLRKLLAVSDDYAVLFLQGGATQQFALLPMNLAAPGQAADHVVTGHWSAKAVAEAGSYVDARVAADAGIYTRIPDRPQWRLSADAAYVHICQNETIHGVEFQDAPRDLPAPLVSDFSSTLLSRPIDVSRYGLIYAGAQKNIGPAGLVVMIVRRDLLERAGQPRANILSYAQQAAQHSMLNTPATFSIYLARLVFAWLLEQGGLAAIGERNARKAGALYAAIDGSGGFYRNPVDPAVRSWMNVPFVIHDDALHARFLAEADAAGLMALKGHKAVGGLRASIYNAMPEAGVEALIGFMRDFQARNG